ncbi:MAG: hypothetical protein IJ715_00720 [Bacilli bacterium]|nr:hypothetical protein [Bacilli bacterium]
MDYIAFINENYVVILLVLVIILMTIIGYFADKKYSSNENVKKEKKNKSKEEDSVDVVDEFNQPSELDVEVNDFDTPSETVSIDDWNMDDASDSNEPVVESTVEEPVESVSVEEPSTEVPVEDTQVEVEQSNDIETEPVNEEAPVEDNSLEVNQTEETENNEEVKETTDATNDYDEYKVDNQSVSVDDWNMESAVEEHQTPVVESDEENSEWTTVSQTNESTEDNSYDLNDNIAFDGVADDDFKLPNIDKLNDELANVDNDEDVWKF